MTSQDTRCSSPSVSDWLGSVSAECRDLIIAIGTGSEVDFGYLRKLFEQATEVTEETWEVKNLIASLAMTNPDVLRGRIALQNAAIERLTNTRMYIKNALANSNKAVSP